MWQVNVVAGQAMSKKAHLQWAFLVCFSEGQLFLDLYKELVFSSVTWYSVGGMWLLTAEPLLSTVGHLLQSMLGCACMLVV